MTDTDFLWQAGGRWREFEVDAAAATFVTTNGTAHLVDLSHHTYIRVPFADGHKLGGDLAEGPLDSLSVATSCGLVLHRTSLADSHHTTQVHLVL